MGKPSRDKGVRGELEVFKIFENDIGVSLQRNTQAQYIDGDCDFRIGGFACEIKRQETLSLGSWWKQVCKDAEGSQEVPALIYRQSRQPWRVVIPFASVSPYLAKWCPDCETYHYEEWAEDFDRTITMMLTPLFTDLVRERMSEEALHEMLSDNTVLQH